MSLISQRSKGERERWDMPPSLKSSVQHDSRTSSCSPKRTQELEPKIGHNESGDYRFLTPIQTGRKSRPMIKVQNSICWITVANPVDSRLESSNFYEDILTDRLCKTSSTRSTWYLMSKFSSFGGQPSSGRNSYSVRPLECFEANTAGYLVWKIRGHSTRCRI